MFARLTMHSFQSASRSLRRPSHWFGLLVLIAVLLAALLSPLSGYQVGHDADLNHANQAASLTHLLGTDHLGRDVFWRLLIASRAFVWPGLLACFTASLLAIPSGAIAGYLGGASATLLRYGFTVVASLPRFVLVLLVCSIYGNDLWLLAVAAGVAYAPTLGEAVHARVEQLRSASYVLANRAHGVPGWRILWVHLVWAACGRLIAHHLLTLFGYFVVLETTLSYLDGFGVQEPNPSWGNMLVFEWGRGSAFSLSVLAPVVAIWLTVGATAWLADALQEVSDG